MATRAILVGALLDRAPDSRRRLGRATRTAPSNTGEPVVSGTTVQGRYADDEQRHVERDDAAGVPLPLAALRHERRRRERRHLLDDFERDAAYVSAARRGRRASHPLARDRVERRRHGKRELECDAGHRALGAAAGAPSSSEPADDLRHAAAGTDADGEPRHVAGCAAADVHVPVAALRRRRRRHAPTSPARRRSYLCAHGYDVGHTLRVRVTARNSRGTRSATTTPTGVVGEGRRSERQHDQHQRRRAAEPADHRPRCSSSRCSCARALRSRRAST